MKKPKESSPPAFALPATDLLIFVVPRNFRPGTEICWAGQSRSKPILFYDLSQAKSSSGLSRLNNSNQLKYLISILFCLGTFFE